jgi:hypothetical protein
MLAVCLFTVVLLAPQGNVWGQNATYVAYLTTQELSPAEQAELAENATQAGYTRIHNPVLDRLGVVLWQTHGSTHVFDAIGKNGTLTSLPVKKLGDRLVIPSGRIIVAFADRDKTEEGRRRLVQANFDVVSSPSSDSPWFVVKPPHADINKSVEELRRIPGVTTAVIETLNIRPPR